MDFKFIVSRWANFYFFVANLSEWHFSCRKDYNAAWIKKTGALNRKETKILNDFRKIITKHGFTLGKIFFFFPEKESRARLKILVKKPEFEKIKLAFEFFKPRFEKIFKERELTERTTTLKKTLERQNYRSLLGDLAHLLGNGKNIQKFEIITILSPLEGEAVTAAGGANLDDKSITLELPKLKMNSWEFEYSIGILAHEIGHLFFKKSDLIKTTKKTIKRLKFPKLINHNIRPRYSFLELISELTIELLVPYGYLAQKYFKFKPSEISFSKSNLKTMEENLQNFKNGEMASGSRLRKFLVWRLYPLIAHYSENRIKIDENFIEKIGQSSLIFK